MIKNIKSERESKIEDEVYNSPTINKFIEFYRQKPMLFRIAIVQRLRDVCNAKIRETLKPAKNYHFEPKIKICKHCGACSFR